MANIIKRQYRVNGRNGYWAIDEYIRMSAGERLLCERTIMCVRTKKLANQIVNELNWAIRTFCRDNKIEFIVGCQ